MCFVETSFGMNSCLDISHIKELKPCIYLIQLLERKVLCFIYGAKSHKTLDSGPLFDAE